MFLKKDIKKKTVGIPYLFDKITRFYLLDSLSMPEFVNCY